MFQYTDGNDTLYDRVLDVFYFFWDVVIPIAITLGMIWLIAWMVTNTF